MGLIVTDPQEPKLFHLTMTPTLAEGIVLNELYPDQRGRDVDVIQDYALQMRHGTFRRWTVITFAVLHGRRYLVNGQHTLYAILLAEVPIEVTIEERPVHSLEEMAELYSTFDRHRRRHLRQLMKAKKTAEAVELNQGQTENLSSCMPLLCTGFAVVPRIGGNVRMYVNNVSLRDAFVRLWTPEAAIFFQNIKGAPGALSQNARRAAVMAVAIVTLHFTGTDAEEFWHRVTKPDGLMTNDPRHRLHIFLRTSARSDYEPHVYCRYMAAAWNAAWLDRTPQSLQPGDAAAPIRLEGTPHKGDKVMRYLTPTGKLLKDPQPYDATTWQQEMFPEASRN